MYSSLIDAEVNTNLVLVQVTHPKVEEWLKRVGLFVGSNVIRHNKEFRYHPVRVRGSKGDKIIPAGLATKIYVQLDSGKKLPLAEMNKKDEGHIELFNRGGRHMRSFLQKLGFKEKGRIIFLRSLPHMDYITLVNKTERTRLSEGEAARIWGHGNDSVDIQFYFARQNSPFEVLEIMGSPKVCNHLETHGVFPGVELCLEAIEQSQVLHAPRNKPVSISSPGGLRLHMSPEQARAIIVKSETETHSPPED